MAQEIERKFLVTGDFTPFITKSTTITQGYLSSVPERVVRIRTEGNKGFINIKGLGSNNGLSRFEWEKEIPINEALELLNLCEPGIIKKTRHLVPAGKHTFEIDVFYGKNEGLTIAEIELNSEDEKFEKPLWLGKEVTGDTKYYNTMLMKHPYTKW